MSVSTSLRVIVLGCVLSLCGAYGFAADELHLTVYPRVILYYRHPTYLRASWSITAHPENRWWSLAWASSQGVSGSTIGQMEGEDSPIHYQRLIEVSPGVYSIQACVYRGSTRRICESVAAEVFP